MLTGGIYIYALLWFALWEYSEILITIGLNGGYESRFNVTITHQIPLKNFLEHTEMYLRVMLDEFHWVRAPTYPPLPMKWAKGYVPGLKLILMKFLSVCIYCCICHDRQFAKPDAKM